MNEIEILTPLPSDPSSCRQNENICFIQYFLLIMTNVRESPILNNFVVRVCIWFHGMSAERLYLVLTFQHLTANLFMVNIVPVFKAKLNIFFQMSTREWTWSRSYMSRHKELIYSHGWLTVKSLYISVKNTSLIIYNFIVVHLQMNKWQTLSVRRIKRILDYSELKIFLLVYRLNNYKRIQCVTSFSSL